MTAKLEAKIIRRKRVLKSLRQLMTAIYLYFEENLSFQRLSDLMACRYGIVMTDVAWNKQFLKAAPYLWEAIQQLQAKAVVQAEDEAKEILNCSSIYAIDATNFSVQGGKHTVARVHTLYSINEHRSISAEITDHHATESLQRFPLQSGAVYFADRAYGTSKQLAYALEQKAYFVIRLGWKHIKLFYDADCHKSLLIPDLMKGDAFSAIAYFKYRNNVYYIRLVGTKIPEEKQENARKRILRKASQNQRKVSSKTLEAAKWMVLATTFSDDISDLEITQAYRLRWQIELHFKRSKTLLNFHKLRRSSAPYRFAIVSLWIFLVFLLSALQLQILSLTNFSISDFNAFSLASSLFL